MTGRVGRPPGGLLPPRAAGISEIACLRGVESPSQSLSPGFRVEARVVRSGLCGSIQQFKGAFDAMMPSYRVVRGAGGQVGALVGLPADMAVVGDRPTTRTPPGRPWAHHASPACLARTTGSRSTCAGPGHGRPGCSTAKTPATPRNTRFSATSYTPAGLIRNGCPSGTPRSSNPSPSLYVVDADVPSAGDRPCSIDSTTRADQVKQLFTRHGGVAAAGDIEFAEPATRYR